MNFGRSCKKNGAAGQPDEGERWGCLVQDRASRFVVASATGQVTRGTDRAGGDHDGPAHPPAGITLVKLRLARLPEHPQASLSKAGAYRQTGTAPLGGTRDGHLDQNGQASR